MEFLTCSKATLYLKSEWVLQKLYNLLFEFVPFQRTNAQFASYTFVGFLTLKSFGTSTEQEAES